MFIILQVVYDLETKFFEIVFHFHTCIFNYNITLNQFLF